MVNEHGGLAKIDHDNHDMSKSWCKSQETNWDFTLHSTGSWDCTELSMWPIRIGNLSNTNMDLASLMSKKWLFRILFVKLILSLIFEHLFWGDPQPSKSTNDHVFFKSKTCWICFESLDTISFLISSLFFCALLIWHNARLLLDSRIVPLLVLFQSVVFGYPQPRIHMGGLTTAPPCSDHGRLGMKKLAWPAPGIYGPFANVEPIMAPMTEEAFCWEDTSSGRKNMERSWGVQRWRWEIPSLFKYTTEG
jgi:hypothetical protein